MKRLIAEAAPADARRGDPGAAEPRRTGGSSSSRAGATDLGGLSANGDHISPEHPFPSPTQVRKRLRADGLALTERLCVYPEYIDPEWIAQPVLDVIKAAVLVVHPAAGSGRRDERARSPTTPRRGGRARPRRARR